MTGDFAGRCSVMWVGNGLEVLEADPRVMISTELIERVRGGYGHPAVTLDGDVMTIRGMNRTVVYRIGEHLSDVEGYRAEWPD